MLGKVERTSKKIGKLGDFEELWEVFGFRRRSGRFGEFGDTSENLGDSGSFEKNFREVEEAGGTSRNFGKFGKFGATLGIIWENRGKFEKLFGTSKESREVGDASRKLGKMGELRRILEKSGVSEKLVEVGESRRNRATSGNLRNFETNFREVWEVGNSGKLGELQGSWENFGKIGATSKKLGEFQESWRTFGEIGVTSGTFLRPLRNFERVSRS